MFRLSKITDYGILLLAHMANRNEQTAVQENDLEATNLSTARELAEAVDLPLPVVSKILKSLAREGTLESHRGAKGGYSLRANADRITVAEMISVLEGPVAMTECAASSGLCLHESSCSVREPWQMINRVVEDALGKITLADLARTNTTSTRTEASPFDHLIRIAAADNQPSDPQELAEASNCGPNSSSGSAATVQGDTGNSDGE